MKLHLCAILVPVFVALMGSSMAPAADPSPDSNPLFLWKATSKANTIYLLGSIHVANEKFYPLPAEIEKAFAESRVLAVEVDLTKVDQEGMQGAMMQKGMYPGSDVIGNHVPRATLDKMRAYFAAKGMPGDAMEKFRPWALAVTITMLELQTLGYESSLGVDKHFMDKAGGRRIVELESADEQINLLSGFPEKTEAEFLAATLASASEAKDVMAKTMAMWSAGDAAGMEKLLITDSLKERPGLKPVYAKLFDERNEKMARKVEAFLKDKEPHFVVVGGGHLIGNKGIIRLLEKKGYAVEQMTRAEKPEAVAAEKKDEKKPAKPAKRGYAPAGAFSK